MKKIILFIIVFSCVCFSQENFWEQTNGPSLASFKSIVFNSKGEIFGGNIEGVFMSTDNGDNWNKIAYISTNSLIINSIDYIFAGTNDGIFKSTDNGNNWDKIYDLPVGPLAINSLDEIFAGVTSGGLIKSTNAGENWTEILESRILSLAISPNDYLFVGSIELNTRTAGDEYEVGGLNVSTDNGITWTSKRFYFVTSFVFKSNEFIIATGYRSDLGNLGDRVILRSTNNGEDWETIYTYGWLFNSDDIKKLSLAINSNGVIFAGANGEGIIRSTDNGDNWNDINKDINIIFIEVSSLAISPSGDVFAGIIGGVLRSKNNGDNWTKIDITFGHPNGSSLQTSSLAINSNDYIFAGANGVGIIRSTDNGDNWSLVLGQPSNTDVTCLSINSSDYIFAGSWRGEGIFRSTDNGNTWELVYSGSLLYHWEYIYSLAINSSDDIFAGTYDGLIRSTDEGNSWVSITKDVEVRSVAFDTNGNIFAGTFDKGVLKSTDNGDTWYGINDGLIYNDKLIRALAVNRQGYIFAGSEIGVYRSTDNGELWTEKNTGLTNNFIGDLKIDSCGNIFAAINNYYIGEGEEAQEGVFISTDNGDHWSPLNSGLISRYVNSLAIDHRGYIFAATGGGGVFRSVTPANIPVELLSFNGFVVDNIVKLEWYTATEINNKGFEIERSLNEKTNWQKIGFVEGNGTTTDKKSYSFVDKSISIGTYFYRLKQIDFDGSYHYSKLLK